MPTTRRQLTWLACDALAAGGRKPSIASVREWTIAHHGKKQGSDTDTQADINAWFAALLALKQEKQTVAGLPDDVAALARGLWLKANEAAADMLAEQRAAIDAELANAEAAAAAADARAIDYSERAAATHHDLDVAREAIRRLEAALAELRATAQAMEVRHTGQLQARQERIEALTGELARKDTEYATRLVDLDGVRKHALLQIEEARSAEKQLKALFDGLASEHQSALAAHRQIQSEQEAALASALGRLSAIEEALAESRQRAQALEEAAARAHDPVGMKEASPRRPGRGAVQRASPRRQRVR